MSISSNATRLLLVHGDVYSFGGAELVCLRALNVLQRNFRQITLVHAGGPLDCQLIERRCGISIDASRVRFLSAFSSDTLMPRRMGNWALFKYAFALRHARRLAADYSAVICTYGECTLLHPRAMQYIHYPLFFCDRENLVYLGARPGGAVSLRFREAYARLARSIAKWNPRTVRSHAVATNSHWTGEQIRRNYGIEDYRVIYPGAEIRDTTLRLRHFASRTNDFVILGRVVAGKRLELGIEIVRRLREDLGHDVGLDIIGSASAYYQRALPDYVRRYAWIRWHQALGREDLERLVATKKWGLHCFPHEHYGIAPAELQQLGCIVFVPDSGGQREIVTNDTLRYSSVGDAVDKIDRVLRDPGSHPLLLAEIEECNRLHRSNAFERSFETMVEELLGKRV